MSLGLGLFQTLHQQLKHTNFEFTVHDLTLEIVWNLIPENSQSSANLFLVTLRFIAKEETRKFLNMEKHYVFLYAFEIVSLCTFFSGYKMFWHFQRTQEVKKQEKGFRDSNSPFLSFERTQNKPKQTSSGFWPFFSLTCGLSTVILSDALKMSLWKIIFMLIIFFWIALRFMPAKCCLIWKAYITGKPQKVTSNSMSDNSKGQEVESCCALSEMLWCSRRPWQAMMLIMNFLSEIRKLLCASWKHFLYFCL